MSISPFADKEHPPSPQQIAFLLGAKQPLWEALTRFFLESYQLPGELTFGGKNYGWLVWYRQSGKSLASLFPQKNGLVVQVILGRAQVEQALGLTLGKRVGRSLRETPQLHDGRWLYLKVVTPRDVKDIEQLVQLKRRASKPQTAA